MRQIILVLSLVFLLFSPKQVPAIEVIEISQLVPGSVHEYQRVAVLAWVREVGILVGKTGSRNFHVVLGKDNFELDAFMSTVPIMGKLIEYPVIVIGKYMPRGRFGGLLQNDFLIIEYIEKDLSLLRRGGK